MLTTQMSPLQAALFMIEVGMCDCLALANILANVLHLTGAGSDELKSAGSGGDASENGAFVKVHFPILILRQGGTR